MFCNGIADYRRSHIEPAGWECMFPLIGESRQALASEIIDREIETFLATVDSDALDLIYCGKEYTFDLINSLPSHVDSCGEDGEFHTLVISAACIKYKREIKLKNLDQGEDFVHQRYLACLTFSLC